MVSLDPPKDVDSYVHRVGRTGRGGDHGGRAITLLSWRDARLAGQLAELVERGGKEVPPGLRELAAKVPFWGFRGLRF